MKQSIKDWRDRHIAEGLCRYCKKKAKKGKTMCQYHLDYLKWRKRLGVKGGEKK